jgi:hypothetical protein
VEGVTVCASSCKTQGHESWGDCVRSQRLSIGQVDATEQKVFERETDAFKDAVRQGIHPDTTKRADTDHAVRVSNETGEAYVGW